jgi:hypothetical protein
MSSYDAKSRYAKTPTYQVRDRRGRLVTVVAVPPHREVPLAGYHVLKQGQRIDHLASQYLADDAGYWRIAEANDAMNAERLTEQPVIAIPVKGA